MAVPDAYRWVPTCLGTCILPKGILRVGADKDGSELFAGRARFEGDLLPAKVIPSKDVCYVSRAGKEHVTNRFEVLVPAVLSWVHATNGHVPPNAVAAGMTVGGEKLYFGRVTRDGYTTSGKIHPSLKTCFYPYRGEEKQSHEYEVLVLRT